MAEITNELVFEVLKAIQSRLTQVDGKIDEIKASQQATRTQMIGFHQELAAIHEILGRHESRLDRIERRLELSGPTLVP